jgi:hypothetical protein
MNICVSHSLYCDVYFHFVILCPFVKVQFLLLSGLLSLIIFASQQVSILLFFLFPLLFWASYLHSVYMSK